MCVNNLTRVVIDSSVAGIRIHHLLIASPAHYCYATKPHNSKFTGQQHNTEETLVFTCFDALCFLTSASQVKMRK